MRFGNKSVVSKVVPDEKMKYTKDGRIIDIEVNLLAITNRTIAEVLIEPFITGAAYQTQLQLREMKSNKEREKLLFDFIGCFNEKQAGDFYAIYKNMSKSEKEKFMYDSMYDRIYINQLNIGEDTPIFFKCLYALEKFPYLKEDDLYIYKWGREIKVLNKAWVGTMYCVKLKQSDQRGYSARSTGAVDGKSLPTRSFKSKSHLERNSSSCIRFSITEPVYGNIYEKPCELRGQAC